MAQANVFRRLSFKPGFVRTFQGARYRRLLKQSLRSTDSRSGCLHVSDDGYCFSSNQTC